MTATTTTAKTASEMVWTVAENATPPESNGQVLWESGLTVGDLIDVNTEYEVWKRDYNILASEIALTDDGRFHLDTTSEDHGFEIEDHALRQVCEMLGRAATGKRIPFEYVRHLIQNHPDMYQYILARHAADRGDKGIQLRTYHDSIRGYMGDKYSGIGNVEMLEILDVALRDKADNKYELIRPFIGRDGLTVRVMARNVNLPNGDSVYGMGVVIRTGEIGNISPCVCPFIQRHSCTNSTVWTEEAFKLKQVGDKEAKITLLAAAIIDKLGESAEMLNRMMEARMAKLPKIDTVISKLVENNGWSEAVSMQIVRGTEGEKTVAGLVNGITFAAHAADVDHETAYELEGIGGTFLMAGPQYAEHYR